MQVIALLRQTILLSLCLLAPPPLQAASFSDAFSGLPGGAQTSGCGISMSCPTDQPDDTLPGQDTAPPPQCVGNNAGETCGANSGPASQGSATGQDVGAGNPLNLLSGNKYQREADLPALPGVLGLELVRHYNSLRAHRGETRGLGAGWRLSYDTELQISPERLVIQQADGARVIFARNAAQPDQCASTDPGRGEVRITPKPGGNEYTWRWPDGRRLHFDAAGRLTQILAPTGEFVSLLRDVEGRLLQITDPQGRSIRLSYVAKGGPDGGVPLASIDTPAGRFAYAYSAPQSARRSSVKSTPKLTRVSFLPATDPHRPSSAAASSSASAKLDAPPVTNGRLDIPASMFTAQPVREYHYEDARHPAALTGISVFSPDPTASGQFGAQRIATYAYDTVGRAVRSLRGPLPPEGEPGIEEVTLDFPRRGVTVLTNSLGQRSTYLSAVIGGERRILEARGPGCARCGATDVRYRYAANGRLTAVTRLDRAGRPLISEQYRLDDAGRIVDTLRIDLSGARPRLLEHVRFGHASAATRALASNPGPVLITRPSVVPGREHRIELDYNDAGQITRLRETGYSPIDKLGKRTPSAIERSIHPTYTRINGRSVLTQIDGPLPEGADKAAHDNDLVRLEWDPRGSRILAVERAGSARSRITYHPTTGLPQEVIDELGFRTSWRYDVHLQVAETAHHAPDGSPTEIRSAARDAQGRLTELRDGRIDDPLARPLWRRAFDLAGRLQWHAEALGIVHVSTYDAESRLSSYTRRSASFMLQQHWQRNAYGQVEKAWDSTGRSRQWRYDDRGKLIGVIDGLGRKRSLNPGAADDDKNALRKTSDGAPDTPNTPDTAVLLDDFGRPVWQYSPDSGETLRWFDEADRLVQMRDAIGHHARYDYDAQGRIVQQSIIDANTAEEHVTRWQYDGRLLRAVSDSAQDEHFDYDTRGRLSARHVTLKTAQGEFNAVTHYEHDAAGQLIARSLPDGSRLRYERNGQGQIIALWRQTVRSPWLRWLEREQGLAGDFERDFAGLRSYTTGNGLQTLHQRSRSGLLSRIVHRRLPASSTSTMPARSSDPNHGERTRPLLERLLGIQSARAQDAQTGDAPIQDAATPELPGSLGLPDEPGALLDYRYLWDAEGNLLQSRQRAKAPTLQATQRTHAFDVRNQLIASVESVAQSAELKETGVWRYAFDAQQRRVLAQQGAISQQDLLASTLRSQFQPGSHRERTLDQPAHYNANGQPERLGARSYQWDARGRLLAVNQHGHALARYRYDHRGLRIGKTVFRGAGKAERTTHTLYDHARQPLAELDASGRITRQYVWLADLPIAVIDESAALSSALGGSLGDQLTDPPSLPQQIWAGLGRVLNSWLAPSANLIWLHTNHLGAPELATDSKGQAIWRATYAPFGEARLMVSPRQPDFSLNLRLPGQYHDTETGLHYNRQRYYDPERGQYLTPDPLGRPDGPNPYAYVAFNPLKFIDPDGLILFAFDGTNNSDSRADGNDFSNVYKFSLAYDQEVNGKLWYMNGIGRDDRESRIQTNGLDQYDANTARARVDYMLNELDDYIANPAGRDGGMISIDIIGFSRGAAMARDFSNRVATGMQDRRWGDRSDCMEIRFMGLWDTVAQFGPNGSANSLWQLAIPEVARHVFHAVAVNENRYLFPGESIGRGTQRGFIGSHADIGGGYGTGDLSDVALNWIVDQARASGVVMRSWDDFSRPEWGVVTDPVVHDKSIGEENSEFCLRANSEFWANQCSSRRTAEPGGLSATLLEAQNFIIPWSTPGMDADGDSRIIGDVDMESYAQWLQQNYHFVISVGP